MPSLPQAPALILAAGRGQRMRPLTDTCPKPLLRVRGQPLAQWWVQALRRDGVPRIVINTAWLGQQIEDFFAPAAQAAGQAPILFSAEGRDFGHALETAGGIVRALPLLLAPGQNDRAAPDIFWVAAGDIFAPGFVFAPAAVQRFAASGKLAHLWLVPNPPHKADGDFGIAPDGLALAQAPAGQRLHTFSTVALYRRALFQPPWCDIPAGNPQGVAAPLAPLLRRAMAAGQISAELYAGSWTDVGTPERLRALEAAC